MVGQPRLSQGTTCTDQGVVLLLAVQSFFNSQIVFPEGQLISCSQEKYWTPDGVFSGWNQKNGRVRATGEQLLLIHSFLNCSD